MRSNPLWSFRFAVLWTVLFATAPVYALVRPEVLFSNCTEFVGLAPVPEAAARALVPARYELVTDGAGARLVVRLSDCQGIRIGSLPPRPGRVAHIGLMIQSPDGSATDPNTSINNYTLTYASNVASLVLLLRGANVPAALDPDLTYEFAPATGPSELYGAVTPEFGGSPTWFVHGTVTNPAFATVFLANWWYARGASETKLATSFPEILFDFSSSVSFHTSRANLIGQLLGSNEIAHFPVSFRGAFTTGSMLITVAPRP